MKSRLLRMFYLGFKQFQDPYYQGIAAQVAFFFILSIVPILLLLSQILGILNIPLEILTRELLGPDLHLSDEWLFFLKDVFTVQPQLSTNILLIIAAIWAASRIQFALMRISTYTYSGGRDAGRFFRDRARSLLTVVLTVVMVVVVVTLQVYGGVIIRFLADQLLISSWVDKVWTILRWPVAGAIYLLIISFNYYVLPNSRMRYRDVLPGSIFCAAGMLVVTIFYALYTSRAVNNNIIYGSMASIAALMFWFYLISWVMCLGILVNKVWADTRSSESQK